MIGAILSSSGFPHPGTGVEKEIRMETASENFTPTRRGLTVENQWGKQNISAVDDSLKTILTSFPSLWFWLNARAVISAETLGHVLS